MEKLEQIYEGKAKKVYATDDPGLLIVSYKDDATAFFSSAKKSLTFVLLKSMFFSFRCYIFH